ncbi:Peptidyl-prolyl cis-trans isomerase FKBP16-4 chloroplastic [Bienertia sinuspersici]
MPYGFDVGQSERGTVLKGLDKGVEGMRVGGQFTPKNSAKAVTHCLNMQRLLIVPPELAYGSKGVQEIPPNATIEVRSTEAFKALYLVISDKECLIALSDMKLLMT